MISGKFPEQPMKSFQPHKICLWRSAAQENFYKLKFIKSPKKIQTSKKISEEISSQTFFSGCILCGGVPGSPSMQANSLEFN